MMTLPLFDDIRNLVAMYPPLSPPDPAAGLAAWYRAVRPDGHFTLRYPRILLFAGSHGTAPLAATEAEITALTDTTHPLARACRALDAELAVHELALTEPVVTFDPQDCAQAIAYSMMMVDQTVDIIGVAAFGAGVGAAAQRLQTALVHVEEAQDPLPLLLSHGGRETAAVLGLILAARLARVPVVLGGNAAGAALALAQTLGPDVTAHCLFESDQRPHSSGSSVDATGGGLAAAQGVDAVQLAVAQSHC
jgi:nicotinate-nucleotide--dimethylbenzimidazole phosphoribosyltransferase